VAENPKITMTAKAWAEWRGWRTWGSRRAEPTAMVAKKEVKNRGSGKRIMGCRIPDASDHGKDRVLSD
jgi:hypothetical protein